MPVAIVTGSDSGIGKATAVRLAEAGFDLGITWHTDEPGAEGTADEVRALGRRAEVRQVDLADATEAARVVDELAEDLGGLDVLVNNAGTGDGTPFLEMTLDEWRHVLDVDLTAAFICGQRAARRMVDRGTPGRIINITSVHEHIPKPEAAAYCAAKGGLGLLTKVMAIELAPHGILVNAVAPGEIATPMTGQHDEDPEQADRDRTFIPIGRPGHAREMANLVAWLASEESSYVTGSSFVADGGLTLSAAVAPGESLPGEA
jgi:NAD(P)-dependent dehydrogenase (short-subunit alcohol dehydrogenase family)